MGSEVQRVPRTGGPTVVNARYVGTLPRGEWDTMIDTHRHLIKRIARGQKRREYARIGPVRRYGGDLYRVDVWRVRDEPPTWRRPMLVLSAVVGGLALLIGAGWYALDATFRDIGPVNIEGVVGFLTLALIAGLFMRTVGRPMVEVIVKIWQ